MNIRPLQSIQYLVVALPDYLILGFGKGELNFYFGQFKLITC